ncbi:MAG TPA: hypothetical protein VMM18_12810 [Gemmatimonadaceae bacterium]|nr:hypothetical protein [Gemmatimonadaceae bacterium]
METRIERDLRLLKGYAVITTVVMIVLLLGAFRQAAPRGGTGQGERVRFDEIDVQRINVIEPDGKFRMVLSNAARSQGPLYQGKPFFYTGAERPRTGIIFFNDEGTETGGLIFGGRQLGDTGYTGLGHLSFDQFNQDQVFVIQYVDRNGKRRVGVQINDRHDVNIFDWANQRDSIRNLPDGPARTEALRRLQAGEPDDPRVAERVYVGRDTLKSAIVNLSDRMGRPRLRLLVDSLGSARVEFLDADGRVTHRIPDADAAGNP